jgi:DNA-directed RNA polymerase specialized sigma24 family protein
MEVQTGQTASQFRTTSWTLIARAPHSEADMEALLKRYWSPVYAYLRRKGCERHEAEDLTQEFLLKKVLERDLLERADEARGRFRSFLKRSLEHFVVDVHRSSHGRDGSRGRMLVPDDPQALSAAEPGEGEDPARAFDRQWAAAVLSSALERVEAACRADGMERQWTAFEARMLRPVLHGCAPTPIEELVDGLAARDRQEIYSMLQTIKRKINSEVRELIAETVEAPEDVRAELDELQTFLAPTE